MTRFPLPQRLVYVVIIVILLSNSLIAQHASSIHDETTYQKIADAIIDTTMMDGRAYAMLAELCLEIGPRLSGSPEAAKAVEWGRQTMLKYGLENVYLQPVMVPCWIRGKTEEAYIINSPTMGTIPLAVSALGNSIPTPEPGIVAEVIKVHSLEEVQQLGKKAAGKLIFYNRAMDPRKMNTFSGYSGAVDQRVYGAIEAAKVGAAGVLVRSVTTRIDKIPHVGVMNYDNGVPQIPAAAISTEDAELLSKIIQQDGTVRVRLRLDCQPMPDVPSFNVIGEITGTEKPNEVILLSAHLDSWDKGHGAHDDGAGCVQVIEALRLLKILGLAPKRTIRAALFMCEEFGVRGGQAYADSISKNGPHHIVAIESDRGGLTPHGFSVNADSNIISKIAQWKYLFEEMEAGNIYRGGGGPDISPLKRFGTVTIGLDVDRHRYFDYHHSDNDTFDKVNKRELELGAAAMAILAYVLAMEGI